MHILLGTYALYALYVLYALYIKNESPLSWPEGVLCILLTWLGYSFYSRDVRRLGG